MPRKSTFAWPRPQISGRSTPAPDMQRLDDTTGEAGVDASRPPAYMFRPVPTLDELLAGQDVPSDVDPETARALCEALVERRDAVRLAALAASGGAKLAKEARRGLHKLKSRGVDAVIPGSSRAGGEPLKPATEQGEAFASAPDG